MLSVGVHILIDDDNDRGMEGWGGGSTTRQFKPCPTPPISANTKSSSSCSQDAQTISICRASLQMNFAYQFLSDLLATTFFRTIVVTREGPEGEHSYNIQDYVTKIMNNKTIDLWTGSWSENWNITIKTTDW